MKKNFSLFLFHLLFVSFINGQVSLKAISLQEQTTFTLDPGINLVGTTRTSVAIQIPQDTEFWTYAITVSRGRSSTINLFNQVAEYLPQYKIATQLLSAIVVPTGDARCDIYLLDQANVNGFVNGRNTTGSWTYYSQGSLLSVSEGKMSVRNYGQRTMYIGIRNTSGSSIRVTIEAVGVVTQAESAYGSYNSARTDWQSKYAPELVAQIRKYVAEKAEYDKDKLTESRFAKIEECVVTEVIRKYSYMEWMRMNVFGQSLKVGEIYKSCAPQYYFKLTDEENRAMQYGNLGWKAFERGEIENCIELTKRSLEIAPMDFTKGNLALCSLVKGDNDVLEKYMDFIYFLKKYDCPTSRKVWTLNEAIQDIENEKRKAMLKLSDDILYLLRGELNSYNNNR